MCSCLNLKQKPKNSQNNSISINIVKLKARKIRECLNIFIAWGKILLSNRRVDSSIYTTVLKK